MTTDNSYAPEHASAEPQFLPLLLALFFGSGCAALIYEIVWFQLLQLVIGSSAISLGVLLGTFMGGMCLGSLLLPRVVSPRYHPLLVHALIELAIGGIAVVVLFLIPEVNRLYATAGGNGWNGTMVRGIICIVCLLPPTFLMGATLPAIARWIEATPKGVSWLGYFYGGNIAGAVFGCLWAGFYLLRVHDMAVATYAAASINSLVAVAGLALAALTPKSSKAIESREPKTDHSNQINNSGPSALPVDRKRLPPESWTVYVTITLSGMCALGCEVIWTRLLSLMLGGTVYTFSIILAVFLLGLGIGSGIGSFLGRATVRPRILLGACQLLLTGAIAWTAYMLAESLPFWPIDPFLSANLWLKFQLDLVRCIWAIFPAAFLWGASFPLALAAAAGPRQDPGRLVGGIYAANTVGAILGAGVCSIILISLIGTQQAQRILIGVSLISALFVLMPHLRHAAQSSHLSSRLSKPHFSPQGLVTLLVSAVLAGILAFSVSPVPWKLVAYGRYLATSDTESRLLYVGEGMNSSVAVMMSFCWVKATVPPLTLMPYNNVSIRRNTKLQHNRWLELDFDQPFRSWQHTPGKARNWFHGSSMPRSIGIEICGCNI